MVCWPFSKFFNVQETYADTIDWNDCKVESKIDGSIMKAFFYNSSWRWATNGCISAGDALVGDTKIPFLALIRNADNFNDIDFDLLNKDYTYIFELVSPMNQIVIRYPTTHLYHIGTRNNKTGEELRVNIGIEQPKTYDIHSLQDCLDAAKVLNDEYDDVKLEGFVVVDKDWHRIKVKSPAYLALHHAWNNGNISKEKILDMIINNDMSIEELCEEFPRHAVKFYYYKYRLVELEMRVQRFCDYVFGLKQEYGGDRKAIANTIKNHELSGFGFKALDLHNQNEVINLIYEMPISKIAKFIPDYVERDVNIL